MWQKIVHCLIELYHQCVSSAIPNIYSLMENAIWCIVRHLKHKLVLNATKAGLWMKIQTVSLENAWLTLEPNVRHVNLVKGFWEENVSQIIACWECQVESVYNAQVITLARRITQIFVSLTFVLSLTPKQDNALDVFLTLSCNLMDSAKTPNVKHLSWFLDMCTHNVLLASWAIELRTVTVFQTDVIIMI